MLSAVSLPLIASAAALSAALTLVSTRMLDARRRLRPTDMAWILSMVTSAGVAPAALAIDSLNLVCASALNWSTVMGRDTAIFTTCVATVTAVGGGGGGGGEGEEEEGEEEEGEEVQGEEVEGEAEEEEQEEEEEEEEVHAPRQSAHFSLAGT